MAKPYLLNAKKPKGAAAPAAGNITFPQLASAGAVLNVYDKGGNVIPTGIDGTKTSVAWTSSDDTVITVTPDPVDVNKATATSTGKVGANVVLTATFTNLDGSPPIPPAVSDPIDCPAGPPATAKISIGTPA